MKTILISALLLLSFKGFSQVNLYAFSNGDFVTEKKIKEFITAGKKTLPATLDLQAIIYHKVIKPDTVINYIKFVQSKKSLALNPALEERHIAKSDAIKLDYVQDSIFLLLNKKLPSFKLKNLEGKEVAMIDFIGKPLLINFWAIWCTPCVAEMPSLSLLKQKYADKMNFISITGESAIDDGLVDFLKDKGFNFEVLEKGEDFKKELKIRALPVNLFIDKYGVLRFIEGNYPLASIGNPYPLDDKNNFFVTKIEELIKE